MNRPLVMRQVVERLGRLLVAVVLLVAGPAASADAISREKALHALVQKADLPLAREVFGRLLKVARDSAPAGFADNIGRSAALGANWKKGNPQYDKVVALVTQAMEREEAAGGPVFRITRLDVEAALDVPWSEDDIAYIADSIDTPFGQALARLMDAGVAAGFVDNSLLQSGLSPENKAAFEAASAKAHAQYTLALDAANRLAVDDPKRADRLQRLISADDPDRLKRIGAALFRPALRRFGTITEDLRPQLTAILGDYRDPSSP